MKSFFKLSAIVCLSLSFAINAFAIKGTTQVGSTNTSVNAVDNGVRSVKGFCSINRGFGEPSFLVENLIFSNHVASSKGATIDLQELGGHASGLKGTIKLAPSLHFNLASDVVVKSAVLDITVRIDDGDGNFTEVISRAKSAIIEPAGNIPLYAELQHSLVDKDGYSSKLARVEITCFTK